MSERAVMWNVKHYVVAKLYLCVQSHRVGLIQWIIAAIPEEIVITGSEELWILRHESSQSWVIRTIPVLVDTELRDVFASGEHETISECGSGRGDHVAAAIFDRRLAKSVVLVALDHSAARIGQMGHASFVIILIIQYAIWRHGVINAFEDFVDAEAVNVYGART